MKKNLLIYIISVLYCLESCTTDPKRIVEAYIADINKYDREEIDKLSDEKFIILNMPLTNSGHVSIDSLKAIGGKIHLLKLDARNGLVKTTEVWTSVYDSLLNITPQLTLHNTYRFKEGRIKSITVDRIENLTLYEEKRISKASSFHYYLDDEYHNLSTIERQNQLISLLFKYNQLSNSQKKEYVVRAFLKDSEFVSKNNWVRMGLKFKGNSTVFVSVLGINIGTTYSIDDDIIHVVPTPGSYPLTLSIKDGSALSAPSIYGDFIFNRVNKH